MLGMYRHSLKMTLSLERGSQFPIVFNGYSLSRACALTCMSRVLDVSAGRIVISIYIGLLFSLYPISAQ